MKRFFTLALFCLCLLGMYGQLPLTTVRNVTENDGTYLFEKADLFIRNDKTKEIIEHKVIQDTASIDRYDLHLEKSFLKVGLWNGYIKEVLLADRQEYIVDEMMTLRLAKEDKRESHPEMRDEMKYLFESKSLPPYSLRLEGDKLIVTIERYAFGQSDYNFTLEAELILTLTKQNDNNETDNK